MNAMKKIYSIIFAAAAIFAASSCQEEIVEPDLGTQENESMTITAGFGAETKTVLDGLKTYWTEGDQISVFDYDPDANSRRFSIDETATTFEDGKAASATFKYDGEFVWPQNDQPDPLIVALYPYQENAYCDFFDAENNCITGLEIPAEQVALADGFDATATFALAASTYSNKDNLHFTNLYSLLRITIDEEGVQQVKVEFTGGNIAGEAKVQLDLTEGETPVFNGGTLSVTEKGTNVVTLTCQDGFTQDEDYYIAIAPVTYTNIKVYLDDVLVKDTTPAQPKTLEPNTVYNIKDLDQPDDRGLSFPKAEYTAFLGNEFTAPVVSSEIEGATDGVTYSSSEEEVATVDENTGAVTILAVGETVITATAPQTTEYNEATATYTLVVSEKADRELQFSETSVTVTLGDTFTAPELTGTTEGVTYASSNEEVATVDGEGNVTIEGAGETTITASADANETHLAGSAEYTLTVNKAERTLTFSASTFTATVGDSFTPPILTGTPDPSGVKYTSSNTGVATVDENTGAVELVGAGETTITASIEATAEYLADEVTYTITVNSPDVWGICGTFNDWNTVNVASLTYVGDGWYEATDVAIYKDDEFKFVKDNSWDYSLGVNAVVEESKETELNEGNDNNIKVAKNGKFTVRLNPTTKVFTIVCTEENTEDVTVTFDVQRDWNQVNLHLWVDYEGNDNDITLTGDWPGVVLTKNASGKYEYSISAQYIGQRIGYILSNNGNNQTSDATVNLSHSGNELTIEALPDPDVTYDLYLDVTQCWRDGDKQRFAAYFYTDNVGSEWVDMQKISDTIYGVNIPDTKYKKVIFVRLNPSTTENNFNSGNKYNQTGDLTIPTDGKNLFTMTSWDGQTSGWSVKQ